MAINFPSGTLSGPTKILQVVQTTKTSIFSSDATSFTAISGLSASITPSSTSNKILVLVDLKYGGSAGGARILLRRNTTDIYLGDSGNGTRDTHFLYGWSDAGEYYGVGSAVINYLDSPSTTSSVTYQPYVECKTSTWPFNMNRTQYNSSNYTTTTASSIILMEVAS